MEKDYSKFKDLLSEFEIPKYDDWVIIAEKSLKGKPLIKLTSKTYENIDVKPIYVRRIDVQNIKQDIPGKFPNRRNKNLISYKIKPWDIVQKVNGNDSDSFNKDVKHKVNNGVNGLKIKVKHSIKLNSIEDISKAFNEIDLSKVSLFFNGLINGNEFFIALKEYSEKNDIKTESISGGMKYDFISKAVQYGGFENDKSILFKELVEKIKSNPFDNFTTYSVVTSIYRNAGCSAVQELAYQIATLVEYIRNLQNEGLDITTIIRNLRLVLTTSADFFMEIAKFRAMRILISNVISAYDENSIIFPKVYIKSIELNKSNLDIYVNQLRNTIETLSSIIGGVDAIELMPFDYGIEEHSEFSDRITRNIQTVLMEECNLLDVTDPAGGSYYIEALTDELASKAWELFQHIESVGGMIEYLKAGEPQKEIEKIAQDRIKNANTRKDVILGTNKYPNLNDEVVENKHCHCKKDRNIIDPIPQLNPIRLSELFEQLRLNAKRFKDKFKHFPEIFIAGMGPIKQHKARVEFSADFFHVGGFETTYKKGYDSVDEAIEDYKHSNSNVIVICSTDDTYKDLVTEFCNKAKFVKLPTILIVAGYPTEQIEEFKKLGIDEFIHVKANIYEVLCKLQEKLLITSFEKECGK